MLIHSKYLHASKKVLLFCLAASTCAFADDKLTCQLGQKDCDLKAYSSLIIPVSPQAGEDKFLKQEKVHYRCSLTASDPSGIVTGEIKGAGNLALEEGDGKYLSTSKVSDRLIAGKIHKNDPILREFMRYDDKIEKVDNLPSGVTAAIVITNETKFGAKISCQIDV